MGTINDAGDMTHEQLTSKDEQQGLTSSDRQGYTDYTEYEPEEIDI